MDSARQVHYAEGMLSGTKIFSSDAVWRRILAELGAEIANDAADADVDFDSIAPAVPVSPIELKALILAAGDGDAIVRTLCGDRVTLAPGLARIVVAMYKSGGCTAGDLKVAMGYSRDAATHAIEAAVYQLRRQFGHDFILNRDGVYRLGKI